VRVRPVAAWIIHLTEGEAVSHTGYASHCGGGRKSHWVHPLPRDRPARVVFKEFCMISDGFHRRIMYTFRDMAGCDRLCCEYGLSHQD
jgi:hypothetical protein